MRALSAALCLSLPLSASFCRAVPRCPPRCHSTLSPARLAPSLVISHRARALSPSVWQVKSRLPRAGQGIPATTSPPAASPRSKTAVRSADARARAAHSFPHEETALLRQRRRERQRHTGRDRGRDTGENRGALSRSPLTCSCKTKQAACLCAALLLSAPCGLPGASREAPAAATASARSAADAVDTAMERHGAALCLSLSLCVCVCV